MGKIIIENKTDKEDFFALGLCWKAVDNFMNRMGIKDLSVVMDSLKTLKFSNTHEGYEGKKDISVSFSAKGNKTKFILKEVEYVSNN